MHLKSVCCREWMEVGIKQFVKSAENVPYPVVVYYYYDYYYYYYY